MMDTVCRLAMEFSAKIVNLTKEEITGTAQLELMDAITNNPVDGYFNNIFPSQYFTVAAGASAVAAGSMFVYQKKGMGVLISFPKEGIKR